MSDVTDKEIHDAIATAVAAKCQRVRVVLAEGEPVTVALAARGKRQLGLRKVLGTEEWIGIDCLSADGRDVVDRYRRNVEVVEVETPPAAVLTDPGTPPLPTDRDGQLVAAMVHAQRSVLAPFVGMLQPMFDGMSRVLAAMQQRLELSEAREARAVDESRAQLDAERLLLAAEREQLEADRQAEADEQADSGVAAVVEMLRPALPALAGALAQKPPPDAAAGGGA